MIFSRLVAKLPVNSKMFANSSVSPLAFVLAQALSSIALVEVTRTICAQIFRPQVQRLINETLCVMLICVLAYEKGVIRQKYGDAAWLFAIFCAVLLFSYIFRGAMANPIVAFSAYMNRRLSLQDLVLTVAGMSFVYPTGAFLAYRYILWTWSFGICPFRASIVGKLHACDSFMQVPPLHAFLIEAALSALCLTAGTFGPQGTNGRFFMAAVIPSLTFLGSNYTGALYNPALAQALQFGCRGLSTEKFLFVYWLGPAVGVIVADFVMRGIRGRGWGGPKLRIE